MRPLKNRELADFAEHRRRAKAERESNKLRTSAYTATHKLASHEMVIAFDSKATRQLKHHNTHYVVSILQAEEFCRDPGVADAYRAAVKTNSSETAA